MLLILQMDHNVIVADYAAMDRVLKEERAYILNIVKQIKKAGCNVLLVQKSILRDAVSDLALHFLDKIKCMVIKDVEREDIDFVCKVLTVLTCYKLQYVCQYYNNLPTYRL
jgi:T-complex protein 1 subunit delta